MVLLAVQFAIAWTMPEVTRDTRPVGLIAWHLSVGTAILFLMVVRATWRWASPPPPAPAALPLVLRTASSLTHLALYTLLIVLPLMGWANASSRGWPVHLFGVISLPALAATGSPLAHELGGVHATTALVLLFVASLHVLAALYHRLVLRDRTLQRMAPWLG